MGAGKGQTRRVHSKFPSPEEMAVEVQEYDSGKPLLSEGAEELDVNQVVLSPEWAEHARNSGASSRGIAALQEFAKAGAIDMGAFSRKHN